MIDCSLLAAWRRASRAAVLLPALLLATACERSASEPTSGRAVDVAPASSPQARTPPAHADHAAAPNAGASAAVTTAALSYACPMHPHVRQHGPGQCPLCGMDLVKQAPQSTRQTMPSADAAPVDGASADTADAPAANAAADGDRRILYYYDPMKPEVHFERPGSSPFMDMALVPKYADVAGETETGVAVSAAVVQTLGIRTAMPVRRDVRPKVRVPASVVADARGQARLQARVEGWIERLAVRAVGQSVVAGSVVAEIYSPELVQAQDELLLGADTAGPAAERLRRFGIADRDIQAVLRAGQASRRLPLRAPVAGVVTELGVREGSSVSPDTVVVDISPRRAVWIEAQLFPAQRIGLGSPLSARFTLPDVPGRAWQGENGSMVPVADPVTQTVAVRFPLDDAGELPLGTVLDAEVQGTPRANVLLAPASAVIRTARGDRVLVARGERRFLPTPVTLGPRYGEEVEIVEGIAETDRIVTSGQFLLDAEASLQSGLDQMGEPDAVTP